MNRYALLLLLLPALAPAQNLPPWARNPLDCQEELLLKNAPAPGDRPGTGKLVQQLEIEIDAQFNLQIHDIRITRAYDQNTVGFYWNPASQEFPRFKTRLVAANYSCTDFQGFPNSDGDSRDEAQIYLSKTIESPDPNALIVTDISHRQRPPTVGPLGYRLPLEPHRWIEVTITHPIGIMPIITYGWLVEDKRTERDGKVIHHYHATQSDTVKILENLNQTNPQANRGGPFLQLSLASSWNEIATAYAQHAESLLAQANLPNPDKSLIVSKQPLRTALNLAHWLNQLLSPTSSNHLLPQPPMAVYASQAGSQADKALLLVGWLRKAKIDAVLALVDTANLVDLDLPCVAGFDSVLVYLPKQQAWIDPARGFQLSGLLPAIYQDRTALLLTPLTTAPLTTPTTKASENSSTFHAIYDLSQFGRVAISSTRSFKGALEDEWRLRMGKVAKEDRAEAFLLESTEPGDFKKPLQVSSSRYEFPELEDGGLSIQVNSESHPDPFFNLMLPFDGGHRRSGPYRQGLCQEERHIYEFILPPGFDLATPITQGEFNLGVARLNRKVERKAGRILIEMTLDTGPLILSPAELEQTLQKYREYEKSWFATKLSFTSRVQKKRDASEAPAIPQLDKLAKNPREHNWAMIQKALVLNVLGQQDQAIQLLHETQRLNPDDLGPTRALAWLTFARREAPGWPRETCIAALQKLMERDPLTEHPNLYALQLASAIEHDEQGERFGRGLDLTTAYEIRNRTETFEADEAKTRRQELLLVMGKFTELADEEPEDSAAGIAARAGALVNDSSWVANHLPQARLLEAFDKLIASGQYAAAARLARAQRGDSRWLTQTNLAQAMIVEQEALERAGDSKPLDLARHWVALVMNQAIRTLDQLVDGASLSADRAAFERLVRAPWLESRP